MHAVRWMRIAQAFALACPVVLMLLSWTPGAHMRRTALPGVAEHFIAYLITALAAAVAFRRVVSFKSLAVLLIAYAAVLEVGQSLVPLRHPAWRDFLMGSLGSLAGIGLAGLLGGYRRRE